ncbi:hypothetical protein GCM10010123_36120 [Pilimelia anulata]|uniref:Fibronectin type-III domain-containing protein n=1 Tax=Pilimelia anulata TaxID=53371 RepID=A0A8J3FF21_9ACTN|nr:hypothetical protein [Pilimelia anulata]GGK02904.1 hypothetical protein GCM10010123_36120 [Pilimelia anulata]
MTRIAARAAGRPRGRRAAAVLAAAAVAPLLTGCAALGLGGEDGSGGDGSASGGGSGGVGWQVYVAGRPQASPTEPPNGRYPSKPGSGYLPYPAGGGAGASASPACTSRLRMGTFDSVGVTPSAGSALVTWAKLGDSRVQTYRVAAVPQLPVNGVVEEPTWVTVPAGSGCGEQSTTIGGLRSGGQYVFWVDAVATIASGTNAGVQQDKMRGRSVGVRIP